MDEQKSEVRSFYKDKTIFITGASGFMGKVLIEKLLYSCSDLDKIYILLRAKRDQSYDTRLNDIFKLPLFQRIWKQKPQVLKKVIPLNGDICSNNLGLSDEYLTHLANEVHVIFHMAATIRFNARLKDAVNMNLIGTSRVLDFAKEMKNLQAFVHLSTTFCHVDQEKLDERIYDSSDDPQDIMRLVQMKLNEDIINFLTPKLIHPYPNTYTYSKCLAETLVNNEYPNLPCCIARPSIVMPSLAEPIPGWIDNMNGLIGLLIGVGKGFLKSIYCKAHYHVEVIPVDIAINSLIVIAYRVCTGQEKSKGIPVYNITQNRLRPITWGEMVKKSILAVRENPYEGQIWYPVHNICSSKFVQNISVFFIHIIPAYIIDFLMLIFRQKRFMVRIQNRCLALLESSQYFVTKDWAFYNENLIAINDALSPVDKKTFPTIINNIDVMEYFKNMVLGSRQYCLKEDLSSLPKARRHQRIMYIIHLTTIYLFYFGILYFFYNHFEIVRFCLDYVTGKIVSLPFISGLINKMHL